MFTKTHMAIHMFKYLLIRRTQHEWKLASIFLWGSTVQWLGALTPEPDILGLHSASCYWTVLGKCLRLYESLFSLLYSGHKIIVPANNRSYFMGLLQE